MLNAQACLTGQYTIQCYDCHGNLKWEDAFSNGVTIVGANNMLLNNFSGVSYTASWFLGLITGPGASVTYSFADTMASHAGWTEFTGYTQATRPAASFSTPSGGIIQSSSPAIFTINASAIVGGGFLVSNNTKGGTTGILYSTGNFTTGDRSIVATDELRLSYSGQLTV
jgi:hypothetical protein